MPQFGARELPTLPQKSKLSTRYLGTPSELFTLPTSPFFTFGFLVAVRSGFMEFDSAKSKRGRDRTRRGPPQRRPRLCLLTVYPRRLLQIVCLSLPLSLSLSLSLHCLKLKLKLPPFLSLVNRRRNDAKFSKSIAEDIRRGLIFPLEVELKIFRGRSNESEQKFSRKDCAIPSYAAARWTQPRRCFLWIVLSRNFGSFLRR